MASSNERQTGSDMGLPAWLVRSAWFFSSIAYPGKMDFANVLPGRCRGLRSVATNGAGMVQSWVTLGRGNFCRKSLFLIELLPNPIGQSVTLLSGRLNH